VTVAPKNELGVGNTLQEKTLEKPYDLPGDAIGDFEVSLLYLGPSSGTVPTSTGQAWSYPGIPYPTIENSALTALGHVKWPYDPCTIPIPDDPENWVSDTAGFYYIDQATGTDTGRTYGNPNAPRLTIPSSIDTSAKIVISGAYDTQHDGNRTITGTSSAPAFVVGRNGGVLTNKFVPNVASTHVVFEINGNWTASSFNGKLWPAGSYITIRNASLIADGSTQGIGGIITGSGGHYMIYNCTISGAGLPLTDDVESDTHGIKVSPTTKDVWIIDCDINENHGNAIQCGSNAGDLQERIWIAGCTADNNFQTAFWTKAGRHIVMSNCIATDHTLGGASGHGGFGTQYGCDNLWVIFCKASGGYEGFQGRSSSGGVGDVYVIGNLFYDNFLSGNPGSVSGNNSNAAQSYGSQPVHLLHNTLWNNSGGHYKIPSINSTVVGNIVSKELESNHRLMQAYDPSYWQGAENIYETGGTYATADSSTPQTYATFVAAVASETDTIEATEAAIDFVSASNFHTNSGSVARSHSASHSIYDTFETLYGLSIKVDLDGNPRPSSGPWDAGCYQDT
jgi:hypothetical protein